MVPRPQQGVNAARYEVPETRALIDEMAAECIGVAEAMTGYVVRKAKELGVPAPVTERIQNGEGRGIRGPSETRRRLERVAFSHGSGCTMKFFSPETKTVRPSGVIPIARNSPGRSGSVIPAPISLNTPPIGFVRS